MCHRRFLRVSGYGRDLPAARGFGLPVHTRAFLSNSRQGLFPTLKETICPKILAKTTAREFKMYPSG